ncbi:MAG: IS66 family transposase [Clostridiales bacterium]|nr:IS66 family transposase [Clostridiales bacterium]
MTPEEERLVHDELNMSREQLLMVILGLRRRSAEQECWRNENSRAITAMAKDYQTLKAEAAALREENARLKAALAHVSEIRQLRTNEIFGRGTEKLSDIVDAPLSSEETDEAEKEPAAIIDFSDAAGKKRAGTGRRSAEGGKKRKSRKKQGKREEDFSGLSQKDVFLLDIEALDEQYGEGNWRIAFWHVHSVLEEIPQSAYVRNTYTPVISVGLEHTMVTVPYEAPLLQRSFASPSIAARIMYQKYVLSLPLYRQEMLFSDLGVSLSRQTMCSWILRFSSVYFGPIYEYLYEKLMEVPYHQCDETTLSVNKDGRGAGTKSYLWLHSTSELSGAAPIIMFCFELTRETEHLRKFYEDFRGYISCDAYCSYQVFAKEKEDAVLICGCMMHMRRRYVTSLSLIDRSAMDEDAIAALPETKALVLIGKIYDADEPLKTLPAEERRTRREEEVRPLVEDYFQYIESLDTGDPLMSERLKDAVNYSKNQKEYLCRFLSDGHIPCDNGFAERNIRPISLLRKNSLFCDSIGGAKATAVMYSMVETARANGANAYWYLRYVLETMPRDAGYLDNSFLETMMPWSENYREYEKQRTSKGPPELGLNEYPERPKTPRKTKSLSDAAGEAKKSA